MHHPDPAGDSGSVRKMQHPAAFHRRSSGSGSASSTTSNPVVGSSSGSADDYQPSSLIQPPAASSSPGPHHPHPPPHSSNLQLQPGQPTGAQIKKKSGFQITSVTPAQISVSTNNSIAEDTESYDDLDESHTEDSSSSEILDVSLSRANDAVGAERSSSEETSNNFHEAETPGAVSPNQPSHPHTLTQAQQRGGAIVNGTMHHHHHPPPHQQHTHHLNHAQSYPSAGALPSLAQKMPSNVGGPQESVSLAGPQSVASQSGSHGPAPGATVSVVNPQTSSVSNVNMLSSANVPVRGGISTSASSSSNNNSSSGGGGVSGFPPNVGVAAPAGGSHMSAANVNKIQPQQQQQQQNINSMTTTTACASGGVGAPSGIQGRVVSAAAASAAPAPAVTAATSRFRVVKSDSSSEPFRKGRWTCTDFYDKEAPTPAPSATPASEAAPLGSRQFVAESFAGATERESANAGSVSGTQSHYAENSAGGEAGVSPAPQHAQDYASPPQGYQGIPPSGLSMGVPQSQAHMHTQDFNHPHVKTTAGPSGPGQQAAIGVAHPQQLTYAQAVANQPPSSSQGPVAVQQQKMGYPSLPQQSAASPVSVRPAEYNQPQQGMPQAAASQPLSIQAGSAPAGVANGATPMMGGAQQSQGLIHKQAPASGMPPHAGVAGVAGVGQQPQSHVDVQQQQKPQSLSTQIQNSGSGAQASASSMPPPNTHADHQAQPPAHAAPRMSPHPSSISSAQDPSSTQASVHAAQASASYASSPSFTTTQSQDAQRSLLQHQSLSKLSGGEAGPNAGSGQEADGNANAASALTAPAGLKTVDGEDDGSSGASVVAIDNKIEQAMDSVKSHSMYAVREEVEVSKEQIKESIERNSQSEQENTSSKTSASPEQMAQFQAQVQTGSPPAPQAAMQTGNPTAAGLTQPASHSSGPSA